MLGLVLLGCTLGCGGSKSADAASPDVASSTSAADEAASQDAGQAAGTPSTSPAATSPTEPDSPQPAAAGPANPAGKDGVASPQPARPELAATTTPPGVEPLDRADEDHLNTKCGGLITHLRKVSAGDSGSRARLERIHRILASPPAIAGVDVPRCAKLLQRSVIAYRAQQIESEGINGIKRIMVGLSMAMSAAKPQLCPSAPAVPPQLAALKAGPTRVDGQAWQHPGWRCVRFEQPSQRLQYELRTNAKKQSFEIIARGFPVDGYPAVELFLAGAVQNNAIELSSEVYRRAAP